MFQSFDVRRLEVFPLFVKHSTMYVSATHANAAGDHTIDQNIYVMLVMACIILACLPWTTFVFPCH